MSLTAAELMVRVGADTSAAERDLRGFGQRVGGLLRGVTGAASGAAGALGSMFNVAGGMLMAQTVQNIAGYVANMTTEAMNGYAAYERLGAALQRMSANELRTAGVASSMQDAMAMSSERAKELQGWIQKLGLNSPFESEEIANGLRLGMAYGFTSEQAKRLMQATVDFASGSGATSQAIGRISLALGQMQAKGKVSGQEIMQLTEAGLNVGEILSKAFGKSQAEVMKLVEQGLIPADAAIEAIVSSLENDFGGAAKEQANSFSGLISSMKELHTIGLRERFTGVFQAIQPYLSAYVQVMSSDANIKHMREWGDALGQHVAVGLREATLGIARFMGAFRMSGGGLGGIAAGVKAALKLDKLAADIQVWFNDIDWAGMGASGAQWVSSLVGTVGGWLSAIDWGGIGSSMLMLTGRLAEMVGGFLVGIDWGSIGNWMTVMTWRLSFEVGNKLKEIDWGGMWTTATTWTTDLAGNIGAKLKEIDWAGMWTTATTWTTDLAGVIGAKLKEIDWGGLWTTAVTWTTDLAGNIGTKLKEIDWAGMWATATTWTTDLAGNVGAKLSTIDWGGMWTTSTTWTTDLAGNIGAKLSTIDWGGMWTTATTWTTDLAGNIGAKLKEIDWAGMWTTATTWTTDLAGVIGAKLKEIDWGGLWKTDTSGLASGVTGQLMAIDWAEQQQGSAPWTDGLQEEIVNQLNRTDWQGAMNGEWQAKSVNAVADAVKDAEWGTMSIDLAKFVNRLAEAIRDTDWVKVGGDFARTLMGVFTGKDMTENWKNLDIAVTEAIKSIQWLEIAQAFGNLKGAVEDGIREAVIGAIGAALSQIGVGQILNDIYGGDSNASGMYGKDESAPYNPNLPGLPNNQSFDPYPGRESGDPYWKGGTVLVGERGPELVNLPLGSQVVPNGKTMDFLRNLGIPGFAEGTPGAQPPSTGWAGSASSAFFAGDYTKLFSGVAGDIKSAAKSMKEAAKDIVAAMSKTPGLFGTSKVTKDQMDMAALGVPQNFADDYLRQLTDEVLNGVDWAGVDIQEAAQRAGIDPKLPAEAILKMFAGAWNDSSLFADPKNLDLINMDAVQESLQRQQASDAGKANIQELLGLTAEEMLNQTAAMGSDILTGINAGMAGAAGADTAGTVIAAVGNSFELTEVIAHLAEVGGQWAREIYAGFQNTAAGLPWGSGVTGGATPPTAPPAGGANANGTPYWRGGATWVGERGPELVTLPTGARIFDANESRRLAGQGGGVTVVVNASVASDVDVEALAYRVAKVIKRRGA